MRYEGGLRRGYAVFMRKNESVRGWADDGGGLALVVVGRGEGMTSRIKNYLF